MKYQNERNNEIPCGNSECGFYVKNKSDQQNCDAQNGSGDPAIVSCLKYFPSDGKTHVNIDTRENIYMSPSEICRKYLLQNCHYCEDPTCGDNISPLKQSVRQLKDEINKLKAEVCNLNNMIEELNTIE